MKELMESAFSKNFALFVIKLNIYMYKHPDITEDPPIIDYLIKIGETSKDIRHLVLILGTIIDIPTKVIKDTNIQVWCEIFYNNLDKVKLKNKLKYFINNFHLFNTYSFYYIINHIVNTEIKYKDKNQQLLDLEIIFANSYLIITQDIEMSGTDIYEGFGISNAAANIIIKIYDHAISTPEIYSKLDNYFKTNFWNYSFRCHYKHVIGHYCAKDNISNEDFKQRIIVVERMAKN